MKIRLDFLLHFCYSMSMKDIEFLGKKVIMIEEVDSTQDYVNAKMKEGKKERTCYLS